MKAVTCTNAKLEVVDQPDPEPGEGPVADRSAAVRHLRLGPACPPPLRRARRRDGRDRLRRLHALEPAGRVRARVLRRGRRLRPRHAQGPARGTPVVALPLLRRGKEVHAIGLSQPAPGAYAEQVVVEQSLTFAVPNGLPAGAGRPDRADGRRLARRPPRRDRQARRRDRDRLRPDRPRGHLHAQGPRRAHRRRQRLLSRPARARDRVRRRHRRRPRAGLARTRRPAAAATSTTLPDGVRPGGRHGREAPAAARLPWWHVWRAAERLGAATPKRPVIFECVGVPGIIDGIITGAPLFSRVVVVGVCMGHDRIRPAMAINKEIDLRFVLGYTPLEFRDTLHMLADGKVDAAPLVTGTVGLDGVEAAFDALGDPEAHAKILIDPKSDAASPQPVG